MSDRTVLDEIHKEASHILCHYIEQQGARIFREALGRVRNIAGNHIADHPEPPAPSLPVDASQNLVSAVSHLTDYADQYIVEGVTSLMINVEYIQMLKTAMNECSTLTAHDAQSKPMSTLTAEGERLLRFELEQAEGCLDAAHDARQGERVTEWVALSHKGLLYPPNTGTITHKNVSEGISRYVLSKIADTVDLTAGTRVRITTEVLPPEPEPFIARVTEVRDVTRGLWVNVDSTVYTIPALAGLSHKIRANMSVAIWGSHLQAFGIGYRYLDEQGIKWECTAADKWVATEVTG